jgi:hypothetical protein
VFFLNFFDETGGSVDLMVPKLSQAGVEEPALRKIMVDNPQRLLAFVPNKVRRFYETAQENQAPG